MQNEYKGLERRRFKRYKVKLSVLYRPNKPLETQLKTMDKEVQANMLDVGEGGMCILTDLSLPVDTSLHVRFSLLDTKNESSSFYGTIELMGKVRYCKVIESGAYRIGISFEKLDKISRLEILHFLEILEIREQIK